MLLYESKIWGVADAIMTVLEVFHHRTTRNISVMKVKKGNDG